MKYHFYIMMLFGLSLFGNQENQYDKLFMNLANQGIVIGQDIEMNELYNLIQSNDIYLKDGKLNNAEFNKKVKELLNYKKKQYEQINEKLDSNQQSKTNKEIKRYFDDNNERIEKAQKDLSSSDNDSWFSKFVNYILEIMKY